MRYRDLTGIDYDCDDCIYNDKEWDELPCDTCIVDMQKGRLMSDLISTKESVTKIVDTAIRQILSGEQKLTKEYEQSIKDAVDVILDTARREAQVDIIRCKDCIFHGFCITSPKWAVAPKDDWYCADAERRTDDLQ